MSSSSNRVILLCILSLVVICSLFFLSGETPITTSQGFTDRPVETTDDLVLSQTAAAADASQDNQSTSAASPPPKIDKSDRVPQDKDAQVEAATEMDQDSWHDLLLSGKDAKNFTWEETDFVVEQVVNQMSIGLPETPLRYAVLNRHEGCHNDFLFLAKQLKISFAEFNPQGLFAGIQVKNPNFISENEAKYNPKIRKLANKFCNIYSHVIVVDINPDAKFLMQRILDSPDTCKMKRLILHTTNRFDYIDGDVPHSEKERYWALVKKISLLKTGPKIVWIQNNPVESEYAKLVLGGRYMKFETIRPFGFSRLSSDKKIPDELKDKVVARESGANSDFYRMLKREDVDVVGVSGHYGGPAVLAQYKAYIELPYQFSTMKQYENLANGVVTLLPSPRLFLEMWHQRKSHLDFNFWGFQVNGIDPERLGKDFYRLSDYYHEDLKSFYYYFDSFDELRSMLQKPDLDSNHVRERSVAQFQKWRKEGVEKWKSFLSN